MDYSFRLAHAAKFSELSNGVQSDGAAEYKHLGIHGLIWTDWFWVVQLDCTFDDNDAESSPRGQSVFRIRHGAAHHRQFTVDLIEREPFSV
jgi:hypothetical protein